MVITNSFQTLPWVWIFQLVPMHHVFSPFLLFGDICLVLPSCSKGVCWLSRPVAQLFFWYLSSLLFLGLLSLTELEALFPGFCVFLFDDLLPCFGGTFPSVAPWGMVHGGLFVCSFGFESLDVWKCLYCTVNTYVIIYLNILF